MFTLRRLIETLERYAAEYPDSLDRPIFIHRTNGKRSRRRHAVGGTGWLRDLDESGAFGPGAVHINTEDFDGERR